MPPDDREVLQRLFDTFNEDIAEPSPEWFMLQQAIFRGVALIPFRGTTLEDMTGFMLDGTGVSGEEFDRHSPKPRAALYEELRREVNISINPRSEPTREIVRVASNSRCIIYSSHLSLALCEVGRLMKSSGKLIMHDEPKPYGCSETTMRRRRYRDGVFLPESSLITMQRGFLEEAGIGISDTSLIRLTGTAPQPNDHASSVYRCPLRIPGSDQLRIRVRSIVISHMFGLDICSLGMRTFDDWVDACPNLQLKDGHVLVEEEDVVIAHKPMPLPAAWQRLVTAKIAQSNKRLMAGT